MSFDLIVDTALKMIDKSGLEAFSLRLLADRLNSGTATLYRNVSSKDELLDHVVDRMLGEVALSGGPSSKAKWEEACTRGAEALFAVLKKHPNCVPLLVTRIPIGPNGLALREQSIGGMLAAGFAPKFAARAYTVIAHYVIGFAIQLRPNGASESRQARKLRKLYRSLDPEQYPATFSAAEYIPGATIDEEFRFGLQLIVQGLSTHHRSSGRRPTA